MVDLLTSSFKIALGSLTVNRGRSLLTVLGIVIGVAAVIILVSVGSGLRQIIAGQFASLGTNLLMVAPARVTGSNLGGIGSFAALTNQGRFRKEDLKLLKSINGVAGVAADLDEFIPVEFLGKDFTAIVGSASQDFLEVFNWGMSQGRFFSNSEFESGRKVVVIGDKVKRELFSQSPLGQDLVVGHERFKVIGVLYAKGGFGQFDWDATVYMPLAAGQRFFGRERLDYLYLKVSQTESIPSVTRQAEELLLRRYKKDEFSLIEQKDLFAAADSILGAVTLALGGIAAISLLVGGIGIMNIMLVTVTERTREIGLRKAVGAQPRDILWQFLIEAVVLAILGGVLGIALGFLGSLALSRFLATSVTGWSVALSFVVSAVVGVVFGLLPAYRASQLDPIEALRYE